MQYTYLIGWSVQQKFYYGVRYAKNADPADLWTTYFTSSKHVKQFRDTHGEPDILEIRKTFSDVSAARDWEFRVLTRLGVPKNDKFINKTNNKAISFERGESWKQKRSGLNHHMYGKPSPFKGKTHSAETKAKISARKIGTKTGRTSDTFTDDWKSNISKNHARLSRKQPHEEIQKRREAAKTNGFSKAACDTVWMNDGVKSYRIKRDALHIHSHLTPGRVKTLRIYQTSPLAT